MPNQLFSNRFNKAVQKRLEMDNIPPIGSISIGDVSVITDLERPVVRSAQFAVSGSVDGDIPVQRADFQSILITDGVFLGGLVEYADLLAVTLKTSTITTQLLGATDTVTILSSIQVSDGTTDFRINGESFTGDPTLDNVNGVSTQINQTYSLVNKLPFFLSNLGDFFFPTTIRAHVSGAYPAGTGGWNFHHMVTVDYLLKSENGSLLF